MRIVIAMNLTADNKKAQCDKEKMECEERPKPRRTQRPGRWRQFFKNSYDYSIMEIITV